MKVISRRRFVEGSGVLTLAALAGCTGQDGDDGGDGQDGDGNGGTPTETETPTDDGGGEFTEDEQRVVDFLTSEPATDNFEDTFDDLGGQATVTVGAEGNEGNFAFDPPATKISTGTTVTWEWTGEGGAHNVSATSDSDFDFRSGDAEEGSDVTYEETFDESGVALYVCEPHEGVGMKGGIVVEGE